MVTGCCYLFSLASKLQRWLAVVRGDSVSLILPPVFVVDDQKITRANRTQRLLFGAYLNRMSFDLIGCVLWRHFASCWTAQSDDYNDNKNTEYAVVLAIARAWKMIAEVDKTAS